MRRIVFLSLFLLLLACAQSGREKRVAPVDDTQRQLFQKQSKIAILVGVGAYPEGSGLNPLKYTATDVQDLGAELEKAGYSVRRLVDWQATRGVVERTLSQMAGLLDADQGTILFYFSGHGFAVDGVNYLATYEATIDNLRQDGLPLTKVTALLKGTRARRQMVWVDACRNDPNVGARDVSRRSFSALGGAEGMRMLFSTRLGDVSYEDDTLRHGVFTYYLLRGLRGEAAGADGLVTFQDIATYLSSSLVDYSVRTGRRQRSFDAGEASGEFLITGTPRLVAAAPAPEPVVTTAPRNGTTKVNPKDGLTYAWIPPGTFTMGCSPGDTECSNDEKPAHQVTLTRGFWMGQTEVTQEAYQRVVGSNPSHFKGPRLPVETINWNEAQAYCRAAGMRLPTEAEWEYAARGGETSPRYGALDAIAWHDTNSGNTTHEAGQKQANGFGLHDMLGNVWEWVSDWYQDAYPSGPSTDPTGPASGQYRVLRGGAWDYGPRDTRASYRLGSEPEYRNSNVGVRCAGE